MPTARGKVAATSANGKIYAIGGYGGGNTVEVYDPLTNSWSSAAPMPTARAELAAANVNGKIYAIGGIGAVGANLRTVEVYDPLTDSWSSAALMSTARAQLAAANVNGKIYAVGGLDVQGALLDTVEVYDPVPNSLGATFWTSAASMPTARFSGSAADANGLVYAVGGYRPATLNTVDQYSPPVTIYTFIKN
jgi:N-acetylneuraminic acid mutarotase